MSPARPQKLILSVGGFDVAGVSEHHRYLVHGYRSELISCLVRFREWSVRDLPQSSAGAAAAPARAGEYIVDASAFATGNGVRLVIMLRDATTGQYEWSERQELSLDRWFDSQRAIVQRLATALNVTVSAGRLSAISENRIEDTTAYDLWLQGQSLLLNHKPADWHRGLALMKEAVTGMPNFSLAYCGVANALNTVQISLPGTYRDAERTEEALGHAKEALRLDPVNSRAQLCMAWSYAMASRAEEAISHAEIACDLNDNDAWTRASAINCIALSGAHERAQAMQAVHLTDGALVTPSQWAFHATTCFVVGDYDGCIAAAERAGETYHMLAAWVAAAHVHLGRPGEAKVYAMRFLDRIRSRWQRDETATEQAIGRWFLQAHPILRAEDWRRLRDGLAEAGLPVGDLDESCRLAKSLAATGNC